MDNCKVIEMDTEQKNYGQFLNDEEYAKMCIKKRAVNPDHNLELLLANA
jgi:hypothetical protein